MKHSGHLDSGITSVQVSGSEIENHTIIKNNLIMKNKAIKGALLGGIITLMFACNTKKEEMVDKEQIKKEIQAKEDEFAATYNSGEAKDIGYYADDAKSFFQHRPPMLLLLL